ncbi:hypothetical protein HXX76_009044 [Chlamydomonas incerta]|uniref:phytol kinase n=1 Tax=Chlamydomonas incerta TaxID=51695 RepID=A0A835VWN7_CHLIN|nr:hypothetical protein HXX76_009044 [Chlamydomonas incerta]|eukprot:KAG2432117.1 hypothetical protein HXX76_009044 [Chlamydomonas incerta]
MTVRPATQLTAEQLAVAEAAAEQLLSTALAAYREKAAAAAVAAAAAAGDAIARGPQESCTFSIVKHGLKVVVEEAEVAAAPVLSDPAAAAAAEKVAAAPPPPPPLPRRRRPAAEDEEELEGKLPVAGAGKTCARCKAVTYCCGACQLSHWNAGHARACPALKAAMAASGGAHALECEGGAGHDRAAAADPK